MALQEVRKHLGEDKRCPGVEPISEAVPQGAGRGQSLSSALQTLGTHMAASLRRVARGFLWPRSEAGQTVGKCLGIKAITALALGGSQGQGRISEQDLTKCCSKRLWEKTPTS